MLLFFKAIGKCCNSTVGQVNSSQVGKVFRLYNCLSGRLICLACDDKHSLNYAEIRCSQLNSTNRPSSKTLSSEEQPRPSSLIYPHFPHSQHFFYPEISKP